MNEQDNFGRSQSNPMEASLDASALSSLGMVNPAISFASHRAAGAPLLPSPSSENTDLFALLQRFSVSAYANQPPIVPQQVQQPNPSWLSGQSMDAVMNYLTASGSLTTPTPAPLSGLFPPQQPLTHQQHGSLMHFHTPTALQQIELMTAAASQPSSSSSSSSSSASLTASAQIALAMAASQPHASSLAAAHHNLTRLPMKTASLTLSVASPQEVPRLPGQAPSYLGAPRGTIQVQVRNRRRYSHESFPLMLYRIIQESVRGGKEDIVSWWPDGSGFEIHHPQRFEDEIIPIYFRHKRMASFRRQLSMYGFRRGTSSKDACRYAHELFHRDHPERCKDIKRLSEFKLVMT